MILLKISRIENVVVCLKKKKKKALKILRTALIQFLSFYEVLKVHRNLVCLKKKHTRCMFWLWPCVLKILFW